MTSVTATPTRHGGFLPFVLGAGPIDRLPGVYAWVISLALLWPRYWLAEPFWNSGLLRFARWSAQPFIFEGYGLPWFSPQVWASVTTASELILPVLLVAGFLGRWSALGLAVMAAVIYFVVGGDFAIALEQFPWMLVGLALFFIGPGNVSIDWLLRRLMLRR